MIVLLSYFTNLYANNYHISSTGEVIEQDSIYISYTDLKIVNSKLIELKYEKETNTILRKIIKNDSIIIDTLIINNNKLTSDIHNLNKVNNKYKKQRNIGFGIGVCSIFTIILMLLK